VVKVPQYLILQKFGMDLLDKNKNWTINFKRAMIEGLILFVASLGFNYFASRYAAGRASYPVTDIVLSNLPVVNVDNFIIFGALALLLFTVYYVIHHPHTIPFLLKSAALFIIIRSVFISLTHIGPFTPQAEVALANPIASLGLGNAADLFFSGHTGMPFLGALIFWERKNLRYLYLLASVAFGASVLLGHLHYSIDVLAAFFITYTIFEMSKKFFGGEWHLFHAD
jgi:hypothetical protein